MQTVDLYILSDFLVFLIQTNKTCHVVARDLQSGRDRLWCGIVVACVLYLPLCERQVNLLMGTNKIINAAARVPDSTYATL